MWIKAVCNVFEGAKDRMNDAEKSARLGAGSGLEPRLERRAKLRPQFSPQIRAAAALGVDEDLDAGEADEIGELLVPAWLSNASGETAAGDRISRSSSGMTEGKTTATATASAGSLRE